MKLTLVPLPNLSIPPEGRFGDKLNCITNRCTEYVQTPASYKGNGRRDLRIVVNDIVN